MLIMVEIVDFCICHCTGEEWMMMVIVLHVHGEVGGMHPEDDGGALLVVMQCSLQVVDSN